jgi:hypothetical protein
MVLSVLTLLVLPSFAWSQSEQGMATTWDARTMLKEIVEQAGRFDSLLERVSTAGWGGSAEAYETQVKRLGAEVGYLKRAAEELAVKPDTMTKTLEAFLRMQAVDEMATSVIEGVRRYQNPAVAELLRAELNELAAYKGALQGYLVQLVELKETELRISDEEAQRCRAQLIQ